MDLKSLFSRRQEAILGMDISAWGIKVVGLSGSMGQPVLEQLASIRLPSGHVLDGHIVKMPQVAVALGDLPGLGLLFQNKSKVTKKSETLVFITPKLIN